MTNATIVVCTNSEKLTGREKKDVSLHEFGKIFEEVALKNENEGTLSDG